jgi:transposase
MKRKQTKVEPRSPSSELETGTEARSIEAPDVRRGRPGRRSAEERREAVLQLLSGKASIDQLAMRYGVYPSTIEAWRDEALEGIEAAFKQGSSKSTRETELEEENELLTESVAKLTMQVTLLQRAMGIDGARPTRPARSRR